MTAFLVFAVQAAYVFLLGFQSRNVRDGQYRWAAATSFVLGLFGLLNQVVIVRSVIHSEVWPLAAYVVAGPVGICLAMSVHDRLNRCKK